MSKDSFTVGYSKPGNDQGAGRVLVEGQTVPVVTTAGLVSILVPCCGMLEYTKLCVPSVLKNSRPPFELIFIDIGSLDGTAEYVAGIAAAASVRVEVVRTATDLGIGSAINDALKQARGEYVVLLNNDTVVTDAWLNQLISLASLSSAIGLVGPMSNYAAVPQLVETVPYRVGPRKGSRWQGSSASGDMLVDVAAVNAFAKEYREQHKGKWMEVDRLGGFCLLVKRAVLKKIEATSSLREWTDLKLFDSDILSSKARQAGFTLALCRDLFIHHFGTRTFAHGAPKPEEINR